jgi:hypothetical protein
MTGYRAGKWESKPQWDIIVHWSEWLKLETVTPPNAGKGTEKVITCRLLGGMSNGLTTLENSFFKNKR